MEEVEQEEVEHSSQEGSARPDYLACMIKVAY